MLTESIATKLHSENRVGWKTTDITQRKNQLERNRYKFCQDCQTTDSHFMVAGNLHIQLWFRNKDLQKVLAEYVLKFFLKDYALLDYAECFMGQTCHVTNEELFNKSGTKATLLDLPQSEVNGFPWCHLVQLGRQTKNNLAEYDLTKQTVLLTSHWPWSYQEHN